MKKILLSLLIVLTVFSTTAFADTAITTDSTFTAFTGDSDSTLDGWTGYTKNSTGTINQNTWYTYVSNFRLIGNVMANMPLDWNVSAVPNNDKSPNSSSIFYTAENFGSEYSFSGDFYNFANQSFVYFNSAIAEKDGSVSAKGGYRILADRSGKKIAIQKYINSAWADVEVMSTEAWGWVPCHFDLTFSDGLITANVEQPDKFDITLTADVSSDDDYKDIGFIGFGATSGRISVANINVSYNSEKVYIAPKVKSVGSIFKGYTILSKDKEVTFDVYLDVARDGDVKNVGLYIDNAFIAEMAQNGDCYSVNATLTENGTHTVKVVLTDCYGNEINLAENTFFVSDFISYPAVFKDDMGNEIQSIEDVYGIVNVSFKFNPLDRNFSALTLYAVKYDENGKMLGVYPNKIIAPSKNAETEIDVTISNVSAGQKISAFLFEDYLKPSPLSGGFTLR